MTDCAHEWVLDEVLLDGQGADAYATCTRCGAAALEVRFTPAEERPPLEELELTQPELEALRRAESRGRSPRRTVD